MRRLNPPPAHIQNALEVEKYLRPTTIALVYVGFAALFAALTALIYAVLVHALILDSTPTSQTIFMIIGIFPIALAILAVLIRPHDPLSSYLMRVANFWRRPIEVPSEECTFTGLLGDGETLCAQISFHYPLKYRTQDVKERLYSYVNAAIAKECSTRETMPTNQEIERVIDPALEVLASEGEIPVLYSEIVGIFKLPRAFNFAPGDLGAADYWRTGTSA